MRRFRVLILFVFVLAACAPAVNPQVDPTPLIPEPLITGEPQGEQKNYDGAFIVFEMSGGIAGEMQSWTLYPDGRAVSETGEEKQVDPEVVKGLIDGSTELGFFEMDENYGLFSSCRDCFNYTVTIHDGERAKSVSAVEGGSNPPQEFWELVQQIDGLVE
jgi:hypothetical protein